MVATSPFPGMDPWLEQCWGDVHASLATYTRDQLNDRLGAGLVARMQERVYIESAVLEPRQFVPDVHVTETIERPTESSAATAAATVAEPELLHISQVEVTEPYIEIRDARSDGRVITVIEIVSASNKSTKVGRRQFVQKQREVVRSETNLVEIDLLRAGRGVTLAASLGKSLAYHACVRRAVKPETLEYYGFPLRQRLPMIRIPLRPSDDDVLLDLQSIVDQAYRKGRYRETIDYSKPPQPPLSGDDLGWAQERVRASA